MKKKNKRLLIIILLIITIVSIGLNVFVIKNKRENKRLLSENIEEQVVRISELSTVRYNYTDIISYENAKQFSGLNLPFTNKKFIVKYSGYLKAGIRGEDIDFKIKDKDILVSITEPIILENVINEEDVTFFDEKDGLFNKLDYTELFEILVDAKEKTEEKAIEDGILEDAKSNCIDMIRLFLLDLGFEEVTVEFI